MTLVLIILVLSLVFEFINGFHDTANAIATSVSTKVLTPRQAVALAAACNLLGAMVGVKVATTIGQGLVDTAHVLPVTIITALIAAIAWNLLTWWLGLPSSSSHALIGGLCGSTLAAAHGRWSVIHWSVVNQATGRAEGLWPKVVMPMLVSPIIGIVGGFVLMLLLMMVLRKCTPRWVNLVFSKLQLLSAAWVGFSHGTNDAQKTMGIMALVLWISTNRGALEGLPPWLKFLETPNFEVAFWVKVLCALTMAAGTAVGGWRIIRTLGHKMVRLQPIHGFAAQTTAAAIIQTASHYGIPLSTTQVISTAIMGVGATKRVSAVKWGIVGRILWAWVLTLPVTIIVAYWLERALMALTR
jgi:inorganic phosphate transporter, PiT family